MVTSNPFAFCSSDENDGVGAVARLPANGYFSCSRDEFDDEIGISLNTTNRTRQFSIVLDPRLEDSTSPDLKPANVDLPTSRL